MSDRPHHDAQRADTTPISSVATAGNDVGDELAAQVRRACAAGGALVIHGGGSKCPATDQQRGEVLDVTRHCGIVSYDPTELVLTARAGTPLKEIVEVLAAAQQMLPFEPPAFGAAATLGGTVACGISGPRRPWGGAVRDAVLGVELINGTGERLTFGGQVMKNVAGYDVARLMVGARGTLGVLTQISVKVLPLPEVEATRVLTLTQTEGLAQVVAWNRSPLPLSATCHVDGRLWVRLSGADAAVHAARATIGGDSVDDATAFWADIREQRQSFFNDGCALWRFSLPHAARMPRCPSEWQGEWLIEWAGALRWLRSSSVVDVGVAGDGANTANTVAANSVLREATALGGHVQQYRAGARIGAWLTPTNPALQALRDRLKLAFDPHRIFNAGIE